MYSLVLCRYHAVADVVYDEVGLDLEFQKRLEEVMHGCSVRHLIWKKMGRCLLYLSVSDLA